MRRVPAENYGLVKIERQRVETRIPTVTVRELDSIAISLGMTRNDVINILLARGVDQFKHAERGAA